MVVDAVLVNIIQIGDNGVVLQALVGPQPGAADLFNNTSLRKSRRAFDAAAEHVLRANRPVPRSWQAQIGKSCRCPAVLPDRP